jgi:hypothetical protein
VHWCEFAYIFGLARQVALNKLGAGAITRNKRMDAGEESIDEATGEVEKLVDVNTATFARNLGLLVTNLFSN